MKHNFPEKCVATSPGRAARRERAERHAFAVAKMSVVIVGYVIVTAAAVVLVKEALRNACQRVTKRIISSSSQSDSDRSR